MARKDFIKKPKYRDFMVIPALIFDDERLSIGAKGLYAQLYYSSSSISSLDELTNVSTSTKEELDTFFDELVKIGYIVINKKGEAEFIIKTQSEKTVAKKVDEAQVEEFKNTVQEQPKPLSAFEKLMHMIESYKFDPKVENLLKEYFTNWLNGVGRFGEGDTLHGPVARAAINTLVSFQMSDDDMIECIKTSIDKQWRKFVDQRKGSQPTAASQQRVNTSSFATFDKTQLSSGSYTEDDIKKIKEKAEALDAEGKKGTY